MKEEISKLLNINVDPFTAWQQASKRIQSDLSHYHSDSKDKYTKLKRNDENVQGYTQRTSKNPK